MNSLEVQTPTYYLDPSMRLSCALESGWLGKGLQLNCSFRHNLNQKVKGLAL